MNTMNTIMIAADPVATATANAEKLLLSAVAVVIIITGVWILWQARQGRLSEILGTVGIVVVGLAVVVLGIGFGTAGKAVGQAVLTFFGL